MNRHTQSKGLVRNNLWYYIMLGVPFFWYAFVFIKPMAEGIALSFFKWDGLSPNKTFVGLKNYKTLLFNSSKFWPAFFNSIQYVLFVVIGCVALSLLIAVLIHHKSHVNNVFRAIFYLPCVLSTSAIAFMWSNGIYNPNIGILNTFLEAVGLDFLTRVWLGDTNVMINAIGAVEIYMNLGISVLLFITGLQDVPLELHEAAKIDGANGWQLFSHITLPLLRPTISLVSILTMISAMRSFDLVYLMCPQTTDVLATLLYEEMFDYKRVGTGSATAVILFLLVLVLNRVQKLVIREDR